MEYPCVIESIGNNPEQYPVAQDWQQKNQTLERSKSHAVAQVRLCSQYYDDTGMYIL